MKAMRWLGLLGLILVLAACGAEKLDAVPPELVGTWTTADPLYAGRYIELQPKLVRFGTGEGTFAEHTVVRLERTKNDGVMTYTVHYLDGDMEKDVWTFVHDPAHGNVIRLSHPKQIEWTKQPSAVEPVPGALD